MSTPSGWYPDPSDPAQLRWWDGSGWTQHTHTAPSSHAAPPSYTAPPSPTSAPPSLTKAPAAPPQQNPYASGQHSGQQSGPANPYAEPTRVKAIATPDGQALAGIGYRIGARVLDTVFIWIITLLAGWQLVERLVRYSLATAGDPGDLSASLRAAQDPEMVAISTGLTTIFLAVSAVYTILPLKFYGATPGKLICGIRVRHWDKAGRPSWWQAIVRWVTSDGISSWIPFYVVADYLFPLFDRRRQALHDKLGGTVVVEKDRTKERG